MFSALGFYPVTPVTDQYVLGSPLFEKATLKMPSGKTFTIKGKQNSENNKYVKSITLKGKNWNKPYLRFNDIQSGGLLIFEMHDKPSKSGQKGEKPYSLSLE